MRRSGEGRDSPIALAYAAKLFRISMEQQIPGGRGPGLPVDFLNGPEGVPVAKEHGELGILQSFVPGESGILMGGGRPRGHNLSKEPNSVGLSELSEQLLASEQLRTGIRY
jgi:hypothetical protein